MAAVKGFRNKSARFSGDRSGSFAVLAGVTMSVLALTIGFAVNVAQSYQVKSMMRNALDAAVTSTARDLTTGRITEDKAPALLNTLVRANLGSGFITNGTLSLGPVVIDKSERTIQATLTAKVDLAFPLFIEKNPTVNVNAAAIYSDRKLEVAMMLDITGSMDGQKIRDLRNAATNAVNTILSGQDPAKPRSRVAIVPYSQAVNAGALASLSVYDETQYGGADLPPADDDAIQVNLPRPVDTCATERKLQNGKADFSDDGPYAERSKSNGKSYRARINRDDRVALCPTAKVVPLTADAAELNASISQFRAAGYTAGGIGVQWAYYMLSPKWRSAIRDAGLGTGPQDYAQQKVSKVAILMTDGQFNTAYAGVTGAVGGAQGDLSRANAEAICRNMKNDGIEVFTIGFDLNDPTMSATERQQAKSVLRTCASQDTPEVNHYFEVSTGPELDAAFQEIIRNKEQVFLTR